jgi:Na+-driven multidrug efflux pump
MHMPGKVTLPVFLTSFWTTSAKLVRTFMISDFLSSVAVVTASTRPVFEMLVTAFMAFIALGAMAASK